MAELSDEDREILRRLQRAAEEQSKILADPTRARPVRHPDKFADPIGFDHEGGPVPVRRPDATVRTYYRIHSLRDRSPVGLFRVNHDKAGEMTSFETFNRRTGKWAEDPSKAAHILQGEPGATMISEWEAADLERELFRP